MSSTIGYSTITPRAFIADASFRLMKFLEGKLKDESGKLDEERYEALYAIITNGIPVGEILRRFEEVYREMFEEAYANAVAKLDNPQKTDEPDDEIIEDKDGGGQ